MIRPESGIFCSSVLFEYEMIEVGRVLLLKDCLSPNEEDMVDGEHDEEINEEIQLNDDEPSE